MSENKELTQIEKILDPENTDNIFLYDEEDNELEFEQEAVIGYNDRIYVILAPVSELEGVGEDEGVVFVVDELDGEECLTLVTDDEVIDAVFNEYMALGDEE